MARCSFNIEELARIMEDDDSGHNLAAYIKQRNGNPRKACSKLMTFDPKRVSLNLNVVKVRKEIGTQEAGPSESENEQSVAILNNSSSVNTDPFVPKREIKVEPIEIEENANSHLDDVNSSEAVILKTPKPIRKLLERCGKPESPFLFHPGDSSTPLAALKARRQLAPLNNNVTPKKNEKEAQQNEISSAKKKKIIEDEEKTFNDVGQGTFTVEKELQLDQFLLTPSICTTPKKTNNASSVQKTPNTKKSVIETDCVENNNYAEVINDEAPVNEDAVPSTQDLLDAAASLLHSQSPKNNAQVDENCTFNADNVAKVPKRVSFKGLTSGNLTLKKINLLVEKPLDLVHNEKEAAEVESSSNPLNLAQNASKKQNSLVQPKRMILESSSCPLNLASTPSHKEKQNNLNHMKDIPLNKAPSAPINGEKFADELKHHLARMSNYQIIDLRKRKSEGRLLSTARPQVRRHIEEQLELELIKRKLNESKIQEDDLGIEPLSPPLEFACIEDLVKRIDVATSISMDHQEVNPEKSNEKLLSPAPAPRNFEGSDEGIPQAATVYSTECNEEPAAVLSNEIMSATPRGEIGLNEETAEIVPSPPQNVRQQVSTISIVPPPPLYTSLGSPLKNVNNHITPPKSMADVQHTSPIIPLIRSQVVLETGEELHGEESEMRVSLKPIENQNQNEKDNLLKIYLDVSQNVQKRKFGTSKRRLYTANSPTPLTPSKATKSPVRHETEDIETEVLPPPENFSDEVEIENISKRKSNKKYNSRPSNTAERQSKTSTQSDVFKEPLAPAPKKRKTKATTIAQQEEKTDDCNSTVIRRSTRRRMPTIDLRSEYLQNFYTKCQEKAIERASIYKKQKRLSKAQSRVSTMTSTHRETSKQRLPFSFLGDTNATNSTMKSGLSIRSVEEINRNACVLSPILEPIAENEVIETNVESIKAKPTKKYERKRTVKNPAPTQNKREKKVVEKKQTYNKKVIAAEEEEKSKKRRVENERTSISNVEHSRLNFSHLPVDELNHLFDHHQQTDQNGSKLQEIEQVNEKDQNDNVEVNGGKQRQLRVRLKRVDLNVDQSGDKATNTQKKKRGRPPKMNTKQQQQNTEIVTISQHKSVNISQQNVDKVTNEVNMAPESNAQVNNDQFKLMNWLTGICAAELQTVNYDIFQEMYCAQPSSLVFAELDGIAYAFYDMEERCSLGYLRFMPRQAKKTKRAQKYQLRFIVLSGKFRISTDKDRGIFDVGCMIAINIGARYKIENVTDDIALIMVIKK